MADDSPKSPHPNASTDPDCTSRQALEEALQHRIDAECYHHIIEFLSTRQDTQALSLLLSYIKNYREQVELKYTRLRELIGLTGGKPNAS